MRGQSIAVDDPATEEAIGHVPAVDADDVDRAVRDATAAFKSWRWVSTIWINDPLTDNYAGPFGGMKMPGGGRELGEEGLDSFRETKHVHWDFSDDAKDWRYPYGESEGEAR